MTDRRAFLKQGLLWAAAMPSVAEMLDRMAWQDRRIFALGAVPHPPRGVLEFWTGKRGTASARLLATLDVSETWYLGANEDPGGEHRHGDTFVDQSGFLTELLYRGPTGLGDVVDSVAKERGLSFKPESISGLYTGMPISTGSTLRINGPGWR